MLNVFILSVTMLTVTFPYCYAECFHSKCYYPERHIFLLLFIQPKCRYAECHYAESHYVEFNIFLMLC